jgi:HSP20 family protein
MTKAAGKAGSQHHPGRRSLKPVSDSAGVSGITSAVSLEGNKEEYIVYVAVPGMERKDFSVTIINKKLVVSAVKKEALHCFTGSDDQAFPEWKETFILPDDADTVMTAAVYRNGELEIHIPKGKDNAGVSPVEVFIY